MNKIIIGLALTTFTGGVPLAAYLLVENLGKEEIRENDGSSPGTSSSDEVSSSSRETVVAASSSSESVT